MSWRTRAVLRSWRFPARRKKLLLNQRKYLRWWYPLLFDELVEVPSSGEYWASYFWRAVGGDTRIFTAPRLNPAPTSWRHPDLPREPFLLIHPTAAWPEKYWVPEFWARVRMGFKSAARLPWVMTGGGSESERKHCTQIIKAMGGGIVDLSGRTSLKEYLHALCAARLVLCVDGSASHLAQAWDVPAITLFGPVFPLRWHLPTRRHAAVSAFDHVQNKPPTCGDITPEIFLDACESLVAKNAGLLF